MLMANEGMSCTSGLLTCECTYPFVIIINKVYTEVAVNINHASGQQCPDTMYIANTCSTHECLLIFQDFLFEDRLALGFVPLRSEECFPLIAHLCAVLEGFVVQGEEYHLQNVRKISMEQEVKFARTGKLILRHC